MIKSETGTVSMRGTTPVLVSELAFMVKGMRESFAKEYGESAAEELISRAMEASRAEGDLDEIMKGLINDTFWKRWTIIKVYEHHVLMQSEKGYKESFSNTDIREMIRKGEIRWK